MLENRSLFKAAIIATALAFPAHAEGLDIPEGTVVLSVTGDISVTNDGDAALFDIDMLKELGETVVTTATPWTEGQQTFTGVSLKALTDALNITEGDLKATAINDYAVDIPVSDAVEDGPIIAYMRNDQMMPRREKGPLWVIYPYDSKAEYRSEVIYSRSIWQLDRIIVSR